MPEANYDNNRNLPELRSELRAFQIFDRIPTGCIVHREDSGKHEPHIHRDEWVLVECTDREIVLDELYLVMQSGGPTIWQVVRVRPNHLELNPHLAECVLLRSFQSASVLPNGEIDWRKPVYVSDGYIPLDYLALKTIGRVIGIYVRPPFGVPS